MPEIDRDTAKALVSAFTAFAPLPQAMEGLTLTINTLIAAARSVAHARAIVNEIVDAPGDPARWPSPERIRSVAWSLLTEAEKVNPCQKCAGSGFMHTEKLIGGVVYDFSAPCSCRAPAPPESAPQKKPARDGRMASAKDAMVSMEW